MGSGRILIALGGNALILPGEKGSIEEQFSHTEACMRPVASLIVQGGDVVITHGNGPIVGNILLRNECAKAYIPPMPLSICVADSQGEIGSMMAQSLRNELKMLGSERTVSVLVTHVLVDKDDKAFRDPTKPIGPYYGEEEAMAHQGQGWSMRLIPGRGWRRLVPSPAPVRIMETEAVSALLGKGIIPIASGGGGVPVVEDEGMWRGVDAVIDKDLSAGLLARELGMKRFVILTDVDGVYLNYERDDRKRLDTITVSEARRYLGEGQFPAGSMGPKIEAAIGFLESGGEEVIISLPEEMMEGLQGLKGTRIVP